MPHTALPDPYSQPQAFLEHLFYTAVQRAQPLHSMAAHLPPPPAQGRTLVIGAGKAAASMAHALEALWPPDAPLSGLVITRYHHTPPRPAHVPQRIAIQEAAHPVPDSAGQAAAERMWALTQNLTANDLVLCLISGGGSALLTLPAEGLTLADKQHLNRALLASGADIAAMNCVRKHLSRIKGGRLAAACQPARLVTLAISDVPGDDPSIIASGPTMPDASTCADALAILQRHAIPLPPTVTHALQHGLLETPKADHPCFAHTQFHLIATPQQSLEAAAQAARAAGIHAHILSDAIEGESREIAKMHAALARSVVQHNQPFTRPCVILSGGETTVTIQPQAAQGRGGRAGEFCLGLAQALQGQPHIHALAADTDGIDGTENNAGAHVTPSTLQRASAAGLHIDDFLARNDAWGYFHALGDLFITGPTYTNVNDFRAVLVLW